MRVRALLIAAVWAVSSASGLVAQDEEKPAPKPVTTLDPTVPREQLRWMVRPLTKPELKVEAEAWFELLRNKSRQVAAARLGVKKANEAMSADDDRAAQASLETAATVRESADSAAAATEQRLTDAAAERLSGGSTSGDATPAEASPSEATREDDAASEPADANTDQPQTDDSGSLAGAEESDAVPTAAEAPVPTAAEAPSSQTLESATSMKSDLLTSVNELQDQRTALRDRLEIVLDSLEAKGGDVEELRQYAVAVSGIEVDTSDAGAVWHGIVGWLTSREGGQRLAWNASKFALILLLTYIIGNLISKAVNWLLERKVNLPALAEQLISRTIKNVILLIGFAIALTALEIDVTPIAAAIGATGLVVGLALQGTLSNFASGLMILVNRPFDVGNVVTAAGITGTVDEMNLVSTKFRTFDNQTIYVPNNEIWENVITNITANKKRRVDLEFGIGFGDDFEQAEQIIRDVAQSHELVYSEPPPEVVMHELGESSVNILCRSWAKTSDWWQVKTDLVREVKRRFDAAGITIPYPQRDIHFHQAPWDEEKPAAVQQV